MHSTNFKIKTDDCLVHSFAKKRSRLTLVLSDNKNTFITQFMYTQKILWQLLAYIPIILSEKNKCEFFLKIIIKVWIKQ